MVLMMNERTKFIYFHFQTQKNLMTIINRKSMTMQEQSGGGVVNEIYFSSFDYETI